MATNAENLKAARLRAKARGDCWVCRCRPVEPGYSNCVECRARVQARKRDFVDAGRCACGRMPRRGRTTCARCAASDAGTARRRRKRQRAAGLCFRCNQPATPGFTTCETCAADYRMRAARYRPEPEYQRPCTICGELGHLGRIHQRTAA